MVVFLCTKLPAAKHVDRPPVEVNGKTYTEYQASQEQRRMERNIRALKREENALRDCGESIKVDAIVGKIKAATGEYRDFSDAVGLRAKTERLRVLDTTPDADGLFRKTGNSGVFSALPERMSKKHIRETAKEYGISLKGITLVIDDDVDKMRPEFYNTGRADTQTVGRIDFFPKAFASKEELARTIVHEKIHVEQFREFGSEHVQNNRQYFETLAEEAELACIERMKKEGVLL